MLLPKLTPFAPEHEGQVARPAVGDARQRGAEVVGEPLCAGRVVHARQGSQQHHKLKRGQLLQIAVQHAQHARRPCLRA